MRKVIVVLLAAAMAVAVVGVVGCGNTDKAKTYMDQAKKDWNNAQQEYKKEIGAAVDLFLATTAQQAETAVKQLVEAVKADKQDADLAVKNLLEAAKAEYVKISELTGVDDYVAYAQAMLVAIQKYQALVDADVALDAKLKAAVESGDQERIDATIDGLETDIKNLATLKKDAKDAWNNAESLKKNLK